MAQATAPAAAVRLGILGTTSISDRVVDAMRRAKDVAPVCIASPDLDAAKQFAAAYGVERAAGSYEELIDDDNVDAVYVPLPTVMHPQWVAKAIAAAKHVVCEKPAARDAEQLHQMLQQSAAVNVAFMDAVPFVHHPRLAAIMEQVKAGAIGSAGIRHVESALTFRGAAEFFADSKQLGPDGDPFGCLGDLGWHNVRLSLWAFGYELPVEVLGIVHSEINGIPTSFSGVLRWADDAHVGKPSADLGVGAARTATFFCSFTHAMQESATLFGDTAHITLQDFVLPSSSDATFSVIRQAMVDNDKRVDRETTTHSVKDADQDVAMWERFASLVHDKPQRAAARRACLATQLCMDALLESARKGGQAVKPDPKNLLASYQA